MKRKKEFRKKSRSKNTTLKAIALSQVCMMVLEIFAVCFILSLSLGGVNAAGSLSTAPNAGARGPVAATSATNKYVTAKISIGGLKQDSTYKVLNTNQVMDGSGTTISLSGDIKTDNPQLTSTMLTPAQDYTRGKTSAQLELQPVQGNNRYIDTATGQFKTFDSAGNPLTSAGNSGTLGQITDFSGTIGDQYIRNGIQIPNAGPNGETVYQYSTTTTGAHYGYEVVENGKSKFVTTSAPVISQTQLKMVSGNIDPNQLVTLGYQKESSGQYVIGGKTIQATDTNPVYTTVDKGSLVYDGKSYGQGSDGKYSELTALNTPGASGGLRTDPYKTGIAGLEISAPSTSSGFGSFGLATAGNLVQGLEWAVGSWAIVQALGSMGIVPEEISKPLGTALFAGIMTGKVVNIGADLGYYSAGWAVGAGIIAGYLIFANGYTETKTRTATIDFKCMSWQAPVVQDKATRTAECNKCNTDPLRPCSEYRCKSLGQSCKIINAGTSQIKCIDGAPDDVTSPGIKPWKEILTKDYSYSSVRERPAGNANVGVSGMSITKNGGCLDAWNPFVFGIITTDKNDLEQPAQCKIDFNHTANFDAMAYWMGEVNTFMENHSQSIALPGTQSLQTTFPEIANNGDYKLYVRCKDGNGNTNSDEFVVSFCIDKTPDLTPPEIKAINPISQSPVLYKIDNLTTSVYTNEPSQCKWSRKDIDYKTMENNMSCGNNVWQINAESLYTCTTTLTGIKDKAENDFYFRCQDLSTQKNTMSQSYPYVLYGTQPLTILSVGPSGTVGSSTSIANVSLMVNTDNGYQNGQATCSYSNSNGGTYQQMFDTGGKNTHSQLLDLAGGTYNYYFKCVDLGGNTAYNATTFTVYVDKYAPQVLRFYNTEGKIKVVTNENAVCKYSTTSCNFDINTEGINPMPFDWTTEHWAEWKTDQTYYIKCMDQYNNQPEPSDCSIIIRPYETSKQ